MLSVGQILFKSTGVALQKPDASITDPAVFVPFLTAGLVYVFASFLWVNALIDIPLAVAYPITALSFILVPSASIYIFREDLNMANVAGLGLIIIGIALSQYR